ncbi:MAG: DUF1997 domain-containing protein [Leptolyngbyaceae cyanobacterium RU_5_1]|nr:DUF1997 domain-containing protein [Leptolyngbyaceae cyanobacterium RU_5_1]
MQSYHPIEHQSAEIPDGLLHTASVVQGANYSTTEESPQSVSEPTRFYSQFVDSMELYADRHTVADYFDGHHAWFRRCAQPMKVESIGKNSYAIAIGRFGSFGYHMEPKIGLDLLPQQEGVYRIESLPIPDGAISGYDVDFRAAMELVEIPSEQASKPGLWKKSLPDKITQVQWQLDLTVAIQFPQFIQSLPQSLVQSTGDRLLKQIVRQVSTRLTRKVLEDFHKTHDLPIPKHPRRWFSRKLNVENDEWRPI